MQEHPPHRLRRRALSHALPVLTTVVALAGCDSGDGRGPAAADGGVDAAADGGPPPPPPGTALAAWDVRSEPDLDVPLPDGLVEISGLAADDAGGLYAHADEAAVVYRLDGAGRVVTRFGAGRPVLRADFEGVALSGDTVHLVTSAGSVVSMPVGENDQIVRYGAVRTRLGAVCEVEGLAFDPVWENLLLACKTPRTAEAEDRIRLHHYSLFRAALDGHPVVNTPTDELERLGLPAKLHPSAVEHHPGTDSYLVLAAAEHLLVELDRAGHVVAAVRLPPDRLPQAEGLAVGPDGSLWIATEGRGGRPGRLLRWRAARDEAGAGSTDPGGV